MLVRTSSILRRHAVIVGGGGAGSGAATRLRRLCPDALITVLEKGRDVSFANCGLPYYIGGMMKEDRLTIVGAKDFADKFDIRVRTGVEVTKICNRSQTLQLQCTATGQSLEPVSYDALMLSLGAQPVVPEKFISGLRRPEVLTLRTIPDANAVKALVADARHAVVMGAGFIGIEMAEQLRERGLNVRVLELAGHILPVVDYEMVSRLTEAMRDEGIGIHCGDAIVGVEDATADDRAAHGACKLVVTTKSGARHPADVVICSTGVAPDTAIAAAAGLALAPRSGAIRTEPDGSQRVVGERTIFAGGDCCFVRDHVTGGEAMVPLAGPANRQGRTAGDGMARLFGVLDEEKKKKKKDGDVEAVFCGATPVHTFAGAQGTAIVGASGVAVATTGRSVASLLRDGIYSSAADLVEFRVHSDSHVRYYLKDPATVVHCKVVCERASGRLLGAQATGSGGEAVARRIDVFATFLQMGATLLDLQAAELCYAPAFGAPKDAQNMVGMMGENFANGLAPQADWREWHLTFTGQPARRAAELGLADELPDEPAPRHRSGQLRVLLDVRDAPELDVVAVRGAHHIPLGALRSRMAAELDKSVPVEVTCRSGQRAYFALRTLRQAGYDARLLSGGLMTALMQRHVPLPKDILGE